ncbi:MAG: hypothetical protein AAF513_17640, partial [Pseudomonadota bacterium]
FDKFDWDGMELQAPTFTATGDKMIRLIEMEGLVSEIKVAPLLSKKVETQEVKIGRLHVEVDVTKDGPQFEEGGKQSLKFDTARIDELSGVVDFGGTTLGWERVKGSLTPGHAHGSYDAVLSRGMLITPLSLFPELELREAINRRNTLRANLSEEERKVRSTAQDSSPYDARIKELQGQLDELLVRYTQRHPQVSIIQQSIDDLRVQKANSGGGFSNTNRLLQDSVVYQKLSTLLAEAEAEVAKLQVRAGSYSSRVQQLEGTVDSIPAVEAELTQLDRDYETVREQHQILLNKREAARLTGNIERDSNDVKIRSIDPPFVPTRPTDPDRLLLTVLVLIGSMVAGVLVAFFLSLLNPVFYNKRAL